MLKYILSFVNPKCYDLYLRHDPLIEPYAVVTILSAVLEIEKSMAEFIYNATKESGKWCIASNTSKWVVEQLEFELHMFGLKTFVEVN